MPKPKAPEQHLNVGDRIKQLRIGQKRTLQEVADLCELSKSMLSKIENNKAIPSVASLVKISAVLGTNISDLLEQDATLNTCYTSAKAAIEGFVATGKGYSIFPFASAFHNKKMQPFLFTAKRGEVKDHQLSHEGEEFIYIIGGEMKMEVGNASYNLKAGDSLYFNAVLKHGVMPVSEEVVYIDIFV